MADISQIKIGNTTYNLKDSVARTNTGGGSYTDMIDLSTTDLRSHPLNISLPSQYKSGILRLRFKGTSSGQATINFKPDGTNYLLNNVAFNPQSNASNIDSALYVFAKIIPSINNATYASDVLFEIPFNTNTTLSITSSATNFAVTAIMERYS